MLLGYVCLLAVEIVGGFVSHGVIGGEIVTFIAGIVAGLVTARVAASRPMLHAAVLGVVIISVTIFVAAFSKRPLLAGIPSWYPYAIALLAGFGAFVGGAFVTREKRP